MAENNNIEQIDELVDNLKVLIALSNLNNGTKLAVTKEQYVNYSPSEYTVDGIIIRNEDIDADLLFSKTEATAHFAETGEPDIPETDKRRKNANPNPQFTDLDGMERTAWQLAYHQDTHESGCAICEAVKFGWLPSGGEMNLASENKEAFNEIAEIVQATPLSDNKYWLSTQYSEDYMWSLDMETNTFEFWWCKTTMMKIRPVKSASDYIEVEE